MNREKETEGERGETEKERERERQKARNTVIKRKIDEEREEQKSN